jgi:hypothetical protein
MKEKDMASTSSLKNLHGWAPFLFMALLAGLLLSCSFGPPEIDVSIANVLAKPNSHFIAVALKYVEFREPAGIINTFPNGGIPKILDQKAKIYICDAESAQVDPGMGWREPVLPGVGSGRPQPGRPSELQTHCIPY